jgi:hypothetical protein
MISNQNSRGCVMPHGHLCVAFPFHLIASLLQLLKGIDNV